MGVPPMKHGQDARATPVGKGFCKTLYHDGTKNAKGQDTMKGIRLTWRRAITNTMGRIDRLFTFGPGGRSGLPTGLNTLDKVLQGLRKGC